MEAFNQIAESRRWRCLVSFIHTWIGEPKRSLPANREDKYRVSIPNGCSVPDALREWHQLLQAWELTGPSIWIPLHDLMTTNGVVQIYFDEEGISEFGIRIRDFDQPDPPVINLAIEREVASQSFTSFVTSMVLNDIIFGDHFAPPTECLVDPLSIRKLKIVSELYGRFYSDEELSSANVIFFAYPNDGPVFAKSRNSAGEEFLVECTRIG